MQLATPFLGSIAEALAGILPDAGLEARAASALKGGLARPLLGNLARQRIFGE